MSVSPRAASTVSGSPESGQTITLRREDPALKIGSPLVEKPSASAPQGVLGVVSAIEQGAAGSEVVQLRPAALSEVFSSLQIEASGTLASVNSGAVTSQAHTAGLGLFDPEFKCSGSAPTPNIGVDLSSLRYIFDIDVPNSIDVFIGGSPTFSLGFEFPAQASCSASLTVKVPLADTGLELEIGPEFSVQAGGLATAGFTWKPKLTFAFFRSRTGSGNYDIHKFTNGGNIEFGGTAGISASLALKVGVSEFGRVGIDGSIGPSLEATVSDSGGQTCRDNDGSADADLNAFAHVFFADWTFNIAHITFWKHEFSHDCGPAAPTPSPTPPPAPAPPPPPTPTTVPTTGPTLVYEGATAIPAEDEELEYNGEPVNVAGDRSFEDWSEATGQHAEVSETLPTSLTPYRCVALLAPESLDETTESQLKTYLQQGGTVIAIGEHEGGGYGIAAETLNRFAESLGVGLSLNDDSQDFGSNVTYEINPSPFTQDVFDLGDNWASSLEVSGIAEPLVGTADGEGPLVGAQAVGTGHFVMAGDSNLFTDDNEGFYFEDDNGQLVRDLCP
ncbi:MAG: hypothetical protein WAU42_09380 [Solirubrobacteraceae bacterium]